MSSLEAQNKAVTRRYIEEVWTAGDVDAMDEILTDRQVYHDPTYSADEPLSEFREYIRAYHAAFPDLRYDVDRYVAEGEYVAFWGRVKGTHESAFMNIAATGNHIDIMGIGVVRIENGKIAERWANFDIYGMLQQLGVDSGASQTA